MQEEQAARAAHLAASKAFIDSFHGERVTNFQRRQVRPWRRDGPRGLAAELLSPRFYPPASVSSELAVTPPPFPGRC